VFGLPQHMQSTTSFHFFNHNNLYSHVLIRWFATRPRSRPPIRKPIIASNAALLRKNRRRKHKILTRFWFLNQTRKLKKQKTPQTLFFEKMLKARTAQEPKEYGYGVPFLLTHSLTHSLIHSFTHSYICFSSCC
jgi:hypothetical protein